MRPRIPVTITPDDRRQLEAIVADRNRAQRSVARAKLTRRRLKRGVFRSRHDLHFAINRFFAETNDNPKPFVWTAEPNRIIAAVNRGKHVIESIH